jgi:uncharacterized membrane protein YdjX (TVP38/TMEM64 family)
MGFDGLSFILPKLAIHISFLPGQPLMLALTLLYGSINMMDGFGETRA